MEDLGRLRKLGLWRLMRSVLSSMAGVLICAQHDGEDEEPEDRVSREEAEGPGQLLPTRSRRLTIEQTQALHTKIDLTALSVAESVLRSTGHDAGGGEDSNDDGVMGDDGYGVDYDEFSEWYNAGGRAEAPYLEMLDLGKWPSAGYSVEDDGTEDGTAEEFEEDDEEEEDGEEEDEEEALPERVTQFDPFPPGRVIFSTELARRRRGRGSTNTMVFGPTTFTVRDGDLASLACLEELTELGRKPAADLAALVLASSPAAREHAGSGAGSRDVVRSVIGDALRSSTGGSVTKAVYNAAMRMAIRPSTDWGDQASSFVSFKLSHFFWMFHFQDRFVVDVEMANRAGDAATTPEERADIMRVLSEDEEGEEDELGHAPVLALAAGLAVLGKGAKSEKLAVAWRIFAGQHPVLRDNDEVNEDDEEDAMAGNPVLGVDTNDTGSLGLSRAELFNLLRSLLTGLLALDRVASSQPDVDVRIAVADAASSMAEDAFAHAHVTPSVEIDEDTTTLPRITFNAFAEYYNSHG